MAIEDTLIWEIDSLRDRLAVKSAQLEVAVEKLKLIECNDVNPKTSDVTPLRRQMHMASLARQALAMIKELGGDVKTYIFPRKILYTRNGDNGTTPCPHGGATQGDDFFFKKGIHWPGAMVGGHACADCQFNRGTEWRYVLCKRKTKIKELGVE